MDPQRRKAIQRAIIVIKKATMKNIDRQEVIEFLMDKGMDAKDIEESFVQAQEQVMSPEERVNYLQDLAQSRLRELGEQQKVNKYLTNELTTKTREIELLRGIVKQCMEVMNESFEKKFKETPSHTAVEELNMKLKAVRPYLYFVLFRRIQLFTIA